MIVDDVKKNKIVVVDNNQLEVLVSNDKTAAIYVSEQGPEGIQGPAGPAGPQGPAGQGLPSGGTTGQIIQKASDTNNDADWVDFATPADTWLATKNTDDITEGSNLYYTDVRVSANADVAANTAARHDAVTLGTANGLSLSAQELSLGLASAASTGALSAADWNTFNNKQGSIITGNLTESTSNVLTITGGSAAVVGSGTTIEVDTDLSQYDNSISDFATNTALNSGLALKISLTEKGANSGVATLDSGGKIPASQLPSTVMEFKGTWAASTNTPTLSNGTGNAGDVYVASNAGTVDFGAGNITFSAGDWAVYNGTIWERSINSSNVVSVNGQQGVVVLNADNIDDTSTINKFVTQAQIDDFHVPITLSGTPNYLTLSGQQITLNQIDLAADVTGSLDISDTSLLAGNSLTLTGSTIDFDYQIDQDVRTTDSVQFGELQIDSVANGLNINGATITGGVNTALELTAGSGFAAYGAGTNAIYPHEFYGDVYVDDNLIVSKNATLNGSVDVNLGASETVRLDRTDNTNATPVMSVNTFNMTRAGTQNGIGLQALLTASQTSGAGIAFDAIGNNSTTNDINITGVRGLGLSTGGTSSGASVGVQGGTSTSGASKRYGLYGAADTNDPDTYYRTGAWGGVIRGRLMVSTAPAPAITREEFQTGLFIESNNVAAMQFNSPNNARIFFTNGAGASPGNLDYRHSTGVLSFRANGNLAWACSSGRLKAGVLANTLESAVLSSENNPGASGFTTLKLINNMTNQSYVSFEGSSSTTLGAQPLYTGTAKSATGSNAVAPNQSTFDVGWMSKVDVNGTEGWIAIYQEI